MNENIEMSEMVLDGFRGHGIALPYPTLLTSPIGALALAGPPNPVELRSTQNRQLVHALNNWG